MNSIKERIDRIKTEFLSALKQVKKEEDLEKIRLTYLARKGSIAELMSALKSLSLEEKRAVGPLLNKLKQSCEALFEAKQKTLKKELILAEQAKKIHFDVTAYLPNKPKGSLHPLTQIQEEVNDAFISLGFEIADGPEIENEFYNFEALNIPENHPARDMFDTFWLDIPGLLLRTHTSSVQIRTMQEQKPPLAIAAPGRVYRHEATDASHDYTFMQVEGLMVDKNISLGNLLATVRSFMQKIFEKNNLDIRVRPSYFPFVEPGIEIDIECPFCNHGCSVCQETEWIEICGAGLVHPNVLDSCGIDPNEYSGFAFGFGLTRLAMLKYGIPDIRLLHSSNIEFLKQF
ncbi:MAG: phenylalanine--tRNA ligase subunit alpha [Candidatus Babeliales bacterium]